MFDLEPSKMDKRLHTYPTLAEAIGILISILFIFFLVITNNQTSTVPIGADYAIFTNRVFDNFWGYNGPWITPFFQLFEQLSFNIGYFLWNMINLLGVIYGAKVFNAQLLPLLVSYQMLANLFYGQVTGIVIGSLALLWWSIYHKKWFLAGLGLLFACNKYQLGIPTSATLLLIANISWFERLRIIIYALIGVLISLILYPNWGMRMVNDFQRINLDSGLSISLLPAFGFSIWMIWIPVLFLPFKQGERIIAIICAWIITAPYFQNADLILLFTFPIGAFVWFGNLAYLTLLNSLSFKIQYLIGIPISILLVITWQGLLRVHHTR